MCLYRNIPAGKGTWRRTTNSTYDKTATKADNPETKNHLRGFPIQNNPHNRRKIVIKEPRMFRKTAYPASDPITVAIFPKGGFTSASFPVSVTDFLRALIQIGRPSKHKLIARINGKKPAPGSFRDLISNLNDSTIIKTPIASSINAITRFPFFISLFSNPFRSILLLEDIRYERLPPVFFLGSPFLPCLYGEVFSDPTRFLPPHWNGVRKQISRLILNWSLVFHQPE